MDLIELRNKTRIHYNKTDIDVIDMLIFMLKHDSEIAHIFSEKVQKENLLKYAEKFKTNGNILPQSVLTNALCQETGWQFNDFNLLEFLITERNDFLQFLTQEGFCYDEILNGIKTRKSKVSVQCSPRYDDKGLDSLCENMSENAKKGKYNTILIFTTNAITTSLLSKQSIGFDNNSNQYNNVMDSLKKTFPTEFIGRIDQVIMFNELTTNDYKKIVKYNLNKLFQQLKSRNVSVIYDESRTVDYILNKYQYKQLGVRGIIDVIRNKITIPLVQQMKKDDNENIEIDLYKILY